MLVRCIDFETTGFPEVEGAAICEVGWCDIEVGVPAAGSQSIPSTIGMPMSVLCNPGQPMPPEARAIHHIRDEDVRSALSPLEGLQKLTEGAPDYYVAHNAKFERAFFPGDAVPIICTLKVSLRLWPDAPAHTNQVLRYALKLALGDETAAMPPHRAGPDAYVTAHLFTRMLEEGRATVEDMARWSDEPAILIKVHFGKHRGARWADVPTDYLEWILTKPDMEEDVAATARYHLQLRSAR